MPGRRVPEVTGTLWVDKNSSELRFLEYSYTGLPGVLRPASLGGRVEFRRLANGAWIVSYWYIRMPRLVTNEVYVKHRSGELTRLAGYVDRGGRAEIATDSLGRIDRALVVGSVYDSLAGRGLAGAVVEVPGTGESIVSDDSGHFALAVAASGDQTVVARHPRLS